jgi:hypothetical protein
MFNILKNFFFEPRIAFFIFLTFIIAYMIFLDEEGAFKDFLKFGPDPEQKFLGMKIDTWQKVILLYIIGFFSSLLQAYYGTVMYDFIHSKLWNPAYKEKIQISKAWATVICCVEPLLYWLLIIVQFFITLTMKLQFMIPEFLGQIVVNIPYSLLKISEKKFTK